ncbi:leucine-rich repeat-containing protein kinase family protein [Variovorax sp. PAMC 28711]|uniref:leucine-rich repeat-containing protein kinase family protein n=1 Tax=Variovorax sp. PAMC 28711 TaxID=1795631 RepID=UPI00078EA619|nr:leucine-rich repeat-containing protein kinase family protein [Variovorax sp. PAMC 28711]AMM25210.1 protein kinase [Variovorax sp. PAMC 28711]
MDTLALLRAGRLAGTQRLDLSCGLTEFPREIFDLSGSLEVLNLSGNALGALPHDLHRLHRLRVLFCSDNAFTELPASLGRCAALEMIGFKSNRIGAVPAAALPPALRWLILTDNVIDTLPEEIGACTRLQKLMLAGNRLGALPDAMAACRNLELVRLSANRLDTLPDWLLALPRLSWLAFAGNPLGDAAERAASDAEAVPRIDWHALTVGAKLGEGASGVIYQGTLGRDAEPVAVKLFKGAVTSDGWPRSEMAACIAAGAHPDLIPVRGRIAGHPDGAEGLVMTLIDPAFRTLAGPPSLASCTRDVYDANARWPMATALRIARDIAAAMAHLHARGIAHNDLYAHNILWHPEGGALLGDFGAAALFSPLGAVPSQALQRLEVRAFGCLLEELLAHGDPAPPAFQNAWQLLVDQCLEPTVAARPAFDDMAERLATLQAPA